jgi:DNA polymerase III alpha subunit
MVTPQEYLSKLYLIRKLTNINTASGNERQNMDARITELERLVAAFVKDIPEGEEYAKRLEEELEIIAMLGFSKHFLRVVEILNLTQDIPHITRGSAGSSLICWLLGISDVDPIKERIPLSRFMNPKRDDLPDIDLDFPHWQQETVMNRIFKRWPGQSARVSNYVTYKEKSALREAAKRYGAKGKLKRNFKLEDVVPDYAEDAKRLANKLLGKKRCISKHCGGILIFDRSVPKSLINAENQILLDKYEIEDLEHFKIDILANRGLSQLWEIEQRPLLDYPEEDEATSELLSRGDVLGVTQAESPAMKRLCKAIRPRNRSDCVLATALIRPVATMGRRKATFFQDWSKDGFDDTIVFEDDAIELISEILGCDQYTADMWRRAFAKKNEEKMFEFMQLVGDHPRKDDVFAALKELSHFGLCRAHAINLGRLIWALAYQKAHNPERFWQAALKHCQGSYARWVYWQEAKLAGAVPAVGEGGEVDDLAKTGRWRSEGFIPICQEIRKPGQVEFCGLVANYRVFKSKPKEYITFVTLGTGNGRYLDVVVPHAISFHDHPILWGSGRLGYKNNSEYVTVYKHKKFKLEDIG